MKECGLNIVGNRECKALYESILKPHFFDQMKCLFRLRSNIRLVKSSNAIGPTAGFLTFNILTLRICLLLSVLTLMIHRIESSSERRI